MPPSSSLKPIRFADLTASTPATTPASSGNGFRLRPKPRSPYGSTRSASPSSWATGTSSYITTSVRLRSRPTTIPAGPP